MSDKFGVHLNYFKILDDKPLTDEQRNMVESHIDDCIKMCLKNCRYKSVGYEQLVSEIYWTMVYCAKKWKPELGMKYKSFVLSTWLFLMRRFVTYKVWGHGTGQFAFRDNGHGEIESMDNFIEFNESKGRDDTEELIEEVKKITNKHDWQRRIAYRLRYNECWPPSKIASAFGVHSETVRSYFRQLYKEARWKLQNTSI